MFISKAVLGREGLDVEAASRAAWADIYHGHQAIWSFFPERPDGGRDFLFRRDERHGWPEIYLVSARPPAPPPPWRIDTKPYAPQLCPGERLAFSVRVNPVRTRSEPRERHGKRHDVIMDAKTRLRSKTDAEMPTAAELIQRESSAWLAQRAERHGFAIAPGAVVAEAYQQHRARRGQREIAFSTVDLTGVLTVIDAGRLVETLFNGLGPAKGFGCGLMLVRKIP